MRKNIFRLAPLGIFLLSGCVTTPDDEPSITEKVTMDGATILRSDTGRLTGPSTDDALTIATDFVLQRLPVSAKDLGVVTRTAHRGVTHVKLSQTIDGLRIHGAYAKIAISDRGEVIQSITRLAKANGPLAQARASELDVLTTVMKELGYEQLPGAARSNHENRISFEATEEFYREPTVERIAYIDEAGEAQAGFLVETWARTGNQLDHTIVDGAGKIVSIERRTNQDSYKVFVEDPGKGPQTVVSGPGAGNAQSPSGWLGAATQTTFNISGNNVKTYLDTDANNAADSGGTTVSDGNFLATADLAQQPSTTGNKAVAVQNLFYLNNYIHDRLYTHGFNEANGNFQVNNFGKGGAGNDPVNAEAQDGSGTDNANMATPSDGSSPRMQMYLWTGTTPGGIYTVGGNTYSAYPSSFGPALTTGGVTGNLAVYNDNTGVTSDACEAAAAGSLTGKIAIVDRGTCDFTVKVGNAQKAGAIGVIIANNVATAPFGPGGTSKTVKIPSAMVSMADGAAIKAYAGQSSNLKKNPAPNLMIDGDVDSDIVYHEYCHGLTWRMIGGMSGKLAGAIGEGASDVCSFLINGDDIVGEYAYGDPLGIRRYPYAGYPLSYNDVTGAEVHNDGEVYAGAMWRVLENYLAAGLTADDLMADFVDGMNYTPSTPAFEDMRDGMLQGAAGSGRECLIWKGFADTGIGVGADGVVKPSGALTIVESFTRPASCP